MLAALAMWSKSGRLTACCMPTCRTGDGGAILSQLSQMNVPYKHADSGNAILVPADKGA